MMKTRWNWPLAVTLVLATAALLHGEALVPHRNDRAPVPAETSSVEPQGRPPEARQVVAKRPLGASDPAENHLLERVDARFESGAVTACLVLRSPVRVEPPATLQAQVKIDPPAADVSVAVKQGQLCLEGLAAETRYTITLAKGLRLAGGARSTMPVEAVVRLANLPSSVGFKSGGYVLAKGSAKGVELVTTNVDKVALELVRVPERAMLRVVQRMRAGETVMNVWELRELLNETAAPVWRGTVEVEGVANRTVSTILPVQHVLHTLPEGVFALFARDAETGAGVMPSDVFSDRRDRGDDPFANVQWLSSTNLASTAAWFDDGMLVQVRTLDTAQPVADAAVQVITRNNDIVYRGRTEADGSLLVPRPAVNGEQANQASLMVVRRDGDMSAVTLGGAALDISALDVGGREAPGDLDVYVFTDRGIYRPSEVVHVTGLVRDRLAELVEPEPLSLVVYRPNGSTFVERPLGLSQLGAFTEVVQLPYDAPRGAWRLAVALQRDHEDELGSAQIDVQDFVPERLKVVLTADEQPVAPGDPIRAALQADFLYGAPAGDLGLEGDLTIRPLRESELIRMGLSGFVFGDEHMPFKASASAAAPGQTDAQGHGEVFYGDWEARFPGDAALGVATQPMAADLRVGVQEPGGRTTKAQATRILLPGQDVLALRPLHGEQVDTSVGAAFDVRRLSSDLQPVPLGEMRWTLQRMHRSWTYDRSEWRWIGEYHLSTSTVAQGHVSVGNKDALAGRLDVPPMDWGRYMLTVYDEAERVYLRRSYYSGWSSSAASEAPDFLEVFASSRTFAPGADVEVGVESPFDGQALLAVWSSGLQHRENVPLRKGRNSFRLATAASWLPGAYVVVSAFRPLHSDEGENPLSAVQYMPVRAIGSLYLAAETRRRLEVEVPAAEPMLPRRTQELEIAVPRLAGRSGFAMVQAVDEGILQLTDFKTPAPYDHFFAKRALGVRFHDDYNKLVRADGTVGDIRTGGDGRAGGSGGAALPVVPTKSVVVFAGPVALDAQGRATVPLAVPDFNGTLRVMTTVWAEDAFGAADQHWVVRDPLVVEAVLPRYLAPGDVSSATLIVANTTQSAMDAQIEVSMEGTLQGGSQTLRRHLAAGERHTVLLPLAASLGGIGRVRVDVRNDAGFSVERSWPLSVQYAGRGQHLTSEALSLPGHGQVVVDMAFADEAQVAGRTGYLQVRQPGLLDAGTALRELMSYRWTCSEQTVSKAWPVMQAFAVDANYVDRVGRRVLPHTTVRAWLQESVDRIIGRQSSSGAIGLWREGDDLVDPMLSTSLVGFLVAADQAGFDLPPDTVTSAYKWSYKMTLGDHRLSDRDRVEVLARLVRAVAPFDGRAVRLARSLAEKLDAADMLTVANVAIALRELGDNARSAALEARAVGMAQDSFKAQWAPRHSYYRSRFAAFTEMTEAMYLLGNATRAREMESDLQRKFPASRRGRSVHEAGQIVRVAVARSRSESPVVTVDGARHESRLGAMTVPLPPDVLMGERYSLNVVSLTSQPLEIVAHITAIPKPDAVFEAEASRLQLQKTRYDLNGDPLPADWRSIPVNERLVVVLEARAVNVRGRMQTMISDPVPAGFEIESIITPAIASKSFWWLPELTRVDVTEARDDTFFAAELRDWNGYRSDYVRVAYVLRATTPGRYMPAAAVVEDMYAADVYGLSAAHPVEVLPE